MYANIIVDISHEQLDKTFQYLIPSELEDQIQVGMQVNVPFGKGNRMLTGYIVEMTNIPEFDVTKIKPITSAVEGKVKVEGRLIQLASWIRQNYGSTMNQALKTVIPIKESVKQKAKEYLAEFRRKHNGARVRFMESLIEDEIIEYGLVTGKLSIASQTIKSFESMGIIEITIEEYYRNPIKIKPKDEIRNVLNKTQKYITDSIKKDYDDGIRETYLIHGITGSGKTEVYMELIEHVIKQGKQVIMLIPEISLTYQTVIRFYRRFGDRVSIMNSRLSKGERYDQFTRALKGDIDIMIGPRSALFTPFENIGLIVIDEEHEGAYKSENAPKYHARETAIEIARMNQASVILGSATPSLEAYNNALTGKFKLYTLDERAKDSKLPSVYVVDLREELKEGNRSIFSTKLQELMTDRLEKKQQIMLFLNKRGYAGFISCRACGHVMKCPHCDISLTSHNNGKLVCHFCGFEQPMVKACPKCGSKYISGFRAGTQQVEESVMKMYPQAKVLRMDMDTTSKKGGHEKILSAFFNQEADILIGTQMIVKGHDFPNVTLVGILAADMSLYASDYRAAERTFQLLTQAAGRSGRGAIAGEVIIQTYTPEHYSIITAQSQDYKAFYEQEIMYRTLLNYPPVCNMLLVKLSSKDEKALEIATSTMKIGDNIKPKSGDTMQGGSEGDSESKTEVGKTETDKTKVGNAEMHKIEAADNIQVIGPVNATLYKANDIYNKVIYIKAKSYQLLTQYKDAIEEFAKDNVDFRKISVQFDFNPMNM